MHNPPPPSWKCLLTWKIAFHVGLVCTTLPQRRRRESHFCVCICYLFYHQHFKARQGGGREKQQKGEKSPEILNIYLDRPHVIPRGVKYPFTRNSGGHRRLISVHLIIYEMKGKQTCRDKKKSGSWKNWMGSHQMKRDDGECENERKLTFFNYWN